MRERIYRIVIGVLLVGWMTVIFLFSAQPAAETEATSGGFSYRIVEAFGLCTGQGWDLDECLYYADMVDPPVRKLAHMTEYAILGCLWYLFFIKKGVRWLPVCLAFLYACTDEFHQLFVPGRSGRMIDVLIDTAGAFLGVWIFSFFCKKVGKYCAKKKFPLQ
jgi:VanZ family protein